MCAVGGMVDRNRHTYINYVDQVWIVGECDMTAISSANHQISTSLRCMCTLFMTLILAFIGVNVNN